MSIKDCKIYNFDNIKAIKNLPEFIPMKSTLDNCYIISEPKISCEDEEYDTANELTQIQKTMVFTYLMESMMEEEEELEFSMKKWKECLPKYSETTIRKNLNILHKYNLLTKKITPGKPNRYHMDPELFKGHATNDQYIGI